MSEECGGNGFLWFLAGLGLGALAGVLYAPKAGTETREMIRGKAEEGRDFVVTRARDVREQANQVVDRGREVVDQQKEQFRAAVDAFKSSYHEATTPEPNS
jgi:gas vesicle protein